MKGNANERIGWQTIRQKRMVLVACCGNDLSVCCSSGPLYQTFVAGKGEKAALNRFDPRMPGLTVIKENIRGVDIYIVQAVDDPQSSKSINDNLMALITAINAAYQSDADSITAICPQFPYSRQDRKKAREGITARQIASFLEMSGANRVITLVFE